MALARERKIEFLSVNLALIARDLRALGENSTE